MELVGDAMVSMLGLRPHAVDHGGQTAHARELAAARHENQEVRSARQARSPMELHAAETRARRRCTRAPDEVCGPRKRVGLRQVADEVRPECIDERLGSWAQKGLLLLAGPTNLDELDRWLRFGSDRRRGSTSQFGFGAG